MTRHGTVFVVDDDAALRKALSMSLTERGYDVESFDSAARFLDAADLDKHACLLLDIRMPKISGLELQEKLARRGVSLPIIFLTAHGDIPMSVRAMRNGAIDFLEKPYELSALLKRIEEALAVNRESRRKASSERAVRERYERLTPREREVMKLLVAGPGNTTNRSVASQLGISVRTVETYRARLMEKMQAQSLPELIGLAKICGAYSPGHI